MLGGILAGALGGGGKAVSKLADDNIKDKREAAKQELLDERADRLAAIQMKFQGEQTDKSIKAQTDIALMNRTQSRDQFMAKMGQDDANAGNMLGLKERELDLKEKEIDTDASILLKNQEVKENEKAAKRYLDEFNLYAKQVDSIYNKYPAGKDEDGVNMSKHDSLKAAAAAGDKNAIKDLDTVNSLNFKATEASNNYNTVLSGGTGGGTGGRSFKGYKKRAEGGTDTGGGGILATTEVSEESFTSTPAEKHQWNYDASPTATYKANIKAKKEQISLAESITGKVYIPGKEGITLPEKTKYGRSIRVVLKKLSAAGVRYEVENLDTGETFIKLITGAAK